MELIKIILALILILIFGSFIFYETFEEKNVTIIDSFESCIEAGYPIMESYPRQCKVNKITFTEKINQISELEALSIAKNSICSKEGTITNDISFNPNTNNWWIEMNIPGSKCRPGCIIDNKLKTAEINYRCND